MKLSLQSICITIFVVMIHIAVIAGFSNLTGQPNQFLADFDSETILEDFFGEEQSQAHSPENEITEVVVDPAQQNAGVREDKPSLQEEEKSEPAYVDRQEEAGEISAIVDARLLSGRIEEPDLGDYVRKPKPKKEERSVRAEPVQDKPAEAESDQAGSAPKIETDAKEKSAPEPIGGPHRIRSIRPL